MDVLHARLSVPIRLDCAFEITCVQHGPGRTVVAAGKQPHRTRKEMQGCLAVFDFAEKAVTTERPLLYPVRCMKLFRSSDDVNGSVLVGMKCRNGILELFDFSDSQFHFRARKDMGTACVSGFDIRDRVICVSSEDGCLLTHDMDYNLDIWRKSDADPCGLESVIFIENAAIVSVGSQPNSQLKVWDVRADKDPMMTAGSGYVSYTCSGFSPCGGHQIWCGTDSGSVVVWDLRRVRTALWNAHNSNSMSVHKERVQGIQILKTGDSCISWASDGTVCSLSLSTTQGLARKIIEESETITCAHYDNVMKSLVTGSSWGTLLMCDYDARQP